MTNDPAEELFLAQNAKNLKSTVAISARFSTFDFACEKFHKPSPELYQPWVTSFRAGLIGCRSS